ncbi:prepilin-type N-terminal cleavage/methylation domain-containing protein [Candidatus Woesebacteria bacterium]|nr:prepilin-type N-terminal cleavage/methylation domain-containing protein [Candidatus Woesebacteria bacterium]
MRTGFTILEIIFVLIIIGIFTGLGATSYNYSSQKQLLESDAEFVNELFAKARSNTTARLIEDLSCTNFQGYTVSVVPSSQTFSLIQTCDTTTEVESYTLVESIVTNPISNDLVLFTYPLGNINSARTITLKKENISRCLDLDIDTLGNITQGELYSC